MQWLVRCPSCGEEKARTDYHRDRSRKSGLQTYCRTCHKIRMARWWDENGKASYQRNKVAQLEWRKQNPDRYAERQRRYHLRRKYGLGIVEYNKKLVAQAGLCAICGRGDIELVIDHCHVAGHVRDLLCQDCNRGLGGFNDNSARLEKAIAYLKKHQLEAM